MKNWLIKLAGNVSTLKELAKSFKTDALMILFDTEEDSYILRSSDLEELENNIDVYRRGVEIVADLNGPTRLAVGWTEPIRVANVIEVKSDGIRQEYGYSSANITLPAPEIDMTMSLNGAPPIEISQAAPVPKWLELQRTDKNVQRAFKFYRQKNIEWGDLYIIFEIIQDDIGTNPSKMGWTKKSNENLFTQTVNYYRHGKSNIPRPENPMTLEQSKSFVDSILQQWLDYKSPQSLQ